jgi:hypothetical protein
MPLFSGATWPRWSGWPSERVRGRREPRPGRARFSEPHFGGVRGDHDQCERRAHGRGRDGRRALAARERDHRAPDACRPAVRHGAAREPTDDRPHGGRDRGRSSPDRGELPARALADASVRLRDRDVHDRRGGRDRPRSGHRDRRRPLALVDGSRCLASTQPSCPWSATEFADRPSLRPPMGTVTRGFQMDKTMFSLVGQKSHIGKPSAIDRIRSGRQAGFRHSI